jgi:hypothetical protein
MEGQRVGTHNQELDFAVGKLHDQIAKIVVQPLKLHHRRNAVRPA